MSTDSFAPQESKLCVMTNISSASGNDFGTYLAWVFWHLRGMTQAVDQKAVFVTRVGCWGIPLSGEGAGAPEVCMYISIAIETANRHYQPRNLKQLATELV